MGKNKFDWEYPYLSAMDHLIKNGNRRETRNGVTIADFVRTMRFDLEKGFPLITTKTVNFRLILAELLWFIEAGKKPNSEREEILGRMSIHRLEEIYGKPITQMWVGDAKNFKEKNAQYDGDLGRIYGSQWRGWNTTYGAEIDQFRNLIKLIKTDQTSRYMRVTAWNPGEIWDQALPACHTDFQCFVKDGKLSLHMNQRSCDMFLGVPFNIASYALLTHMLAQVCGLGVGELIITLNDYHIYDEHIEQVKEQLSRKPRPMPRLLINPNVKDIDTFTMGDFQLERYNPHPAIKARVLTSNVK